MRPRDGCSVAGVALAVAVGSLSGQATGSIGGSVIEVGGAAVVGAQVVLDRGRWGALTDDLGNFLVTGLPAGHHAIAIVRIGYATFERAVEVEAGRTSGVQVVLEASAVPLAALTVIGSREELDATRRAMRRIPGAVALLEPADIRQTRQSTLGDVLRFTPGVFAQSRYGAADDTQLSIRGSGLRSNFRLRGVNVLVNGMPYRLADGFTDLEALELLDTDNIQVYKGANALRFGGSTLGGAINLESKTGYTAAPVALYAQMGSFGFTKGQVSSGGSFGDFDYYASYARTDLEGYRDYSGQARDRIHLHAGQRLSDDVDVRAFYWFANVEEDLPGPLSGLEVASDWRAADPTHVANRYGRNYELHHMGVQLRTRLGESARLDVAPYLEYRDILHPFFRVLDQNIRDVGVEARYQDERRIRSHGSDFSLGVQWAWGRNENKQFENLGGQAGDLASNQNDIAGTIAVYAEEVFEITGRVKGVLGARWARDHRLLEDFFLGDGDQTDERDYGAFQPRVGILYELPSLAGQIFANASRMYEPPVLLEMNSLAGPGFIDLSAQDAWQLEIGSRGRVGSVEWDVAAFDIQIADEIININVQPFSGAPFTVPTYRNATETRHYGVEAALSYELRGPLPGVSGSRHRLRARIAYTWGHFEYLSDPSYSGKELPGTPEHYVQGELEYYHRWGLSFKPNVEWVPGTYFVDSANAVEKDGWTTFGFRLDWVLERLSGGVFLEARNLTNERYSPSVVVDESTGRFFYPADGRSLYVGFRWQLPG